MKITIIQIDELSTELQTGTGRYAPFFQTMFARVGLEFDYESVFLLDGESLPDPAGLEAIIIPGSHLGVYDPTDWMDPLRAFIRAANLAGTPMLGVCFGHQIIADALGGDVRKSEKGWGLGRHTYRIEPIHPSLEVLDASIHIAASHQDQVISPPEGARVFQRSEFCEYAGLIYPGDRIMTLQPHPEFDVAFSKALIEQRRGDPLSDDEAEAMNCGLDERLDNDVMARAMGNFLKLAH